MRTTALVAGLILYSSAAFARGHGPAEPQQPQQQQQQQQQQTKRVDLVIALDTSSSMDGLIDSARAKLWDVVNLLSHASPQPILRVGLISYGNSGYDAGAGWVRKDVELTTNLDGVYEKLFALRTNGGDEYVARAVHDATNDLKWDQDPSTLKIIFVAGNEPANQDPKIPVETALAEARAKGIFVNAIYCGSQTSPESSGWLQVAQLGHGKYAAIDQNHIVAVATPMDAELAKLSRELDETYVGYGEGGGRRAALQQSMDSASLSAGPPAAAARAISKGSALYRNDEWDLVDARAKDKKVVKAMPASRLPEPLRKLSEKERDAFLDGKAKQRAEVQKRISELAKQRDGYLDAERKKPGHSAKNSFDDAVTSSIKSEGEAAGLKF
jgi:Mg-chelatase subunit ChlD